MQAAGVASLIHIDYIKALFPASFDTPKTFFVYG